MPLRKALAAVVCIAILGAQLWTIYPISRVTNGWYWPFLSYPMYAIAHGRGDSLVVSELRVATCGHAERSTIVTSGEIGIPWQKLAGVLNSIVRNREAPAESRDVARVTRALSAQLPGRYCAASVWTRVVYVADTSTHHLRGPMRRAAEWPMNRTGSR